MNTTVVGRVAVRVLPETGGFKERLRRDLTKETAGVDAEVPVEANLDTEGLEQELRAKVKELKDRFEVQIRSTIEGLRKKVSAATKAAEAHSEADPITFQAELDSDVAKGMRRGIREAIAQTAAQEISRSLSRGVQLDGGALKAMARRFEIALGSAKVAPEVDMTAARKSGQRFWKRFNEPFEPEKILAEASHVLSTGERIKIPVEFDGSVKDYLRKQYAAVRAAERKAMSERLFDSDRVVSRAILRPIRDAMRELSKLVRDVKVGVKAEIDEASLIETRAELEIWFKRLKIISARVKVVLDKKSVAAVMTGLAALSGGRLFKRLVSLEPFKNLDTQLPAISAIATLLGQAANYVISMTADMLSLGRSLAQIAPLALTLPGVFLATGAAVYAIIAPLSQFNDRIPEISRRLGEMHRRMGEAFWVTAQRGLSQLIKLTPILDRGFTRLGTSAGTFMGALGSSAVTNIGPKLAPFFASIAKAFASLTRAASPITRILGNFIHLGTYVMPRLGEATRKVVGRFDRWLDSAIKGGEAYAWIERAITNTKALGHAVAGTWRLFGGLSRAAEAAGGATLVSFAASMDRIQKIVNRGDFQARLVNVFASARIAIERMVDEAGPAVTAMFTKIGDNAHQLLPRIGQAAGRLVDMLASIVGSDVVGNSLINFFNSLNLALKKLQPSMKNVAKGLGGVIDVMSTMLTSFVPIIEIAFGALERHADGIMRTIQAVVRNLAAGFGDALRNLMPVIERLAPAVLSIVESISRSAGSLAGPLTTALTPLLHLLASVAQGFSWLPGPIQAAVVAFALFKVRALGGVAGTAAVLSFRLKQIGKSFSEMEGPIGRSSRKMAGFMTGLKGFAAKAGLIASGLLLIGQAMGGATISAEKLELAMRKLGSSDMSTISGELQKITNVKLFNASGQLDSLAGAFAEMTSYTPAITEINRAWNSVVRTLGAPGMQSGEGKLRDLMSTMDEYLATLARTDPQHAARMFDQIRSSAALAGVPVEELNAIFERYSSQVALNAGQAAGSFKKSAEEIKSDARELRSSVESGFSRLNEQINGLRGEAQGLAVKKLIEARRGLLKGLAGSVTDEFDKKMVQQATALNQKIAKLVTDIDTTKDKGTRKALKAELDKLLQEYETRFSGLPSRIEDTAGGANFDQLWSKIFQVPAGAGSQMGPQIASQVKTAFASGEAAATAGSTRLKGVIHGAITSVGGLSGGSIAGNLGPKIGMGVTLAFIRGQEAASRGAAALKMAVSRHLATVGSDSAQVGLNIGSRLSKGFAAGSAGFGIAASRYATAFRSRIKTVESAAKTTANRTKSALTFSLFGTGFSVGVSYSNGLRASIPGVIAAAKAITKATKDNKGPEAYDKIMLFENGQWVVGGFIDGLRSSIPAVESTMQDITRRVAGTDFDSAIKRAAKSASQINTLADVSVGTSQYVTQIGDVTIDVSQLEGVKTIDDLAKTLRRRKRQAGG